jgi:tetratricopeptide (TPR) repeat protein
MAQMYYGLGSAYLKKGDKRKARENYLLAVQFAEKNNDENLPAYQDKLKQVKR